MKGLIVKISMAMPLTREPADDPVYAQPVNMLQQDLGEDCQAVCLAGRKGILFF